MPSRAERGRALRARAAPDSVAGGGGRHVGRVGERARVSHAVASVVRVERDADVGSARDVRRGVGARAGAGRPGAASPQILETPRRVDERDGRRERARPAVHGGAPRGGGGGGSRRRAKRKLAQGARRVGPAPATAAPRGGAHTVLPAPRRGRRPGRWDRTDARGDRRDARRAPERPARRRARRCARARWRRLRRDGGVAASAVLVAGVGPASEVRLGRVGGGGGARGDGRTRRAAVRGAGHRRALRRRRRGGGRGGGTSSPRGSGSERAGRRRRRAVRVRARRDGGFVRRDASNDPRRGPRRGAPRRDGRDRDGIRNRRDATRVSVARRVPARGVRARRRGRLVADGSGVGVRGGRRRRRRARAAGGFRRGVPRRRRLDRRRGHEPRGAR